MTGGRKRGGWKVPLVGLAGCVLGATTVLPTVWIYCKGQAPPVLSASSVPPPVPTAPPKVQPQAPHPVRSLALSPDLARRGLLMPVQGIPREALRHTFEGARSEGRGHAAIDITAPRNTPVVAVEDGRIAKLFTSDLGGFTVYQFDPTETYSYYYAHLDHYAAGLKEGDQVSRGQVIGYVGSTGNASPDGPHLHFAITRLGPDKKWWEGEAINPYPLLRGR